jgi:hypothetical protein
MDIIDEMRPYVLFSFSNLAAHVHIFAWPDAFIPHASLDNDLKKMLYFTAADMVEKIRTDQFRAR